MKKITLLIAAFVFAMGAYAQEDLTISFEEDEGYSMGPIAGQANWDVTEGYDDIAMLTQTRSTDGERSLAIKSSPEGGEEGFDGNIVGPIWIFDAPIDEGQVSISYDVYIPEEFATEGYLDFIPFIDTDIRVQAQAGQIGNADTGFGPAEVGDWTTVEFNYDLDEAEASITINDQEGLPIDAFGELEALAWFTTGEIEFNIDNIQIVYGELGVEDFENTSFTHFTQNGQLFLESASQIQDVAIYNLLGQQVVNDNLNATSGSIDLGSLNTGIYMAQVNVDGKVKSFKFSVK